MSNQSRMLPIDTKCRYFIDTSDILTPHDANIFFTGKYSIHNLPFNGGYLRHSIWVKTTILDSSNQNINWIFFIARVLLDSVEYYIEDSEKVTLYARTGRLVKEHWPSLRDIHPSVVMPNIKWTPYSILIRVKTTEVCAISIIAAEMYRYTADKNNTMLLYGLYFGAIGVLVLIINSAIK